MTPGPWEIILVLIVVVLLFGAKRLPDAARSLGRSLRIFKSEVKELNNDSTDQPQQQQALPQQPVTNPQVQLGQQPQQYVNPAQPQQPYNPGQPQQYGNPGQPQQYGYPAQPQQPYNPGQQPGTTPQA